MSSTTIACSEAKHATNELSFGYCPGYSGPHDPARRGRLADAQPPPTSASSADAALAAQKAAFLALPESTRKAAQDALVWLGFYNGVVDGDFGRRTRDAILAFQASAKAPADGALSAPELQALLASAQKARDAVGFRDCQRRQERREDRRAGDIAERRAPE